LKILKIFERSDRKEYFEESPEKRLHALLIEISGLFQKSLKKSLTPLF